MPLSYSQGGEDLKALEIIERWGYKTGQVLEIGAWHPSQLSNSRLFIERGYQGVLCEPAPASVRDLAREYDGTAVVIVAAPVTVHGGLVRLHLTDDALSGETIEEQWRQYGGYYGAAWFNSLSVEELVRQYGGDFVVCSIDTEGTSVDLFAELMRCGPRPRVVIVEHNNRLVEVNGIAEANHYRQAHVNGNNVIFEWTGAKE